MMKSEHAPESRIVQLLDRQAIGATVIRYATGVDDRDWTLFRSCFTDPVEIDVSSWTGSPAADIPADDWVAGVRSGLSGFDSTHHMSSNHRIELDGDRATCISYVQARHCIRGAQGDEICTLGGHYHHRLQREPDGWRIHSSRLVVAWSEGDRGLFERALRRGPVSGERA